MFIGRKRELGALQGLLDKVGTGPDSKPGRALLIRGRRRVGKSRLVEEFVQAAGVPYLFYAATGRPIADELALFAEEVARSNLPGRGAFQGLVLSTWDAALRQLAAALPQDGPSVIVIDALPYLVHSDDRFEATLQTAFDRELSRRRVLLIGIGSDLAMMEMLNEYGRPFHQRATEMIVPALSPRETGTMLGLSAADAFDAYLVTGGLPLILDEWPSGATLWEYLEHALSTPTSALLVSAERALSAEFPSDIPARGVLSTIGGTGARTFTTIAKKAGVNQAVLNRALDVLAAKRLVVRGTPLSTAASNNPRYRIADPYLRFWLEFVESGMPRVERGAGREVLARIKTSWDSWRGLAIEPVVHEGLDRLALPLGPAGRAGAVGGYWTRINDPEIAIVVADKAPVADEIYAVGSIKWKEGAPFDGRDHAALIVHRSQLPGATDTTPLLAVSRTGADRGLATTIRIIEPGELLTAWP